MGDKVRTVIIFIIAMLLLSGGWIFAIYKHSEKLKNTYNKEISQLTAKLDALGTMVECYTVTEEYYAYYDKNTTGQVIQNNGLQAIQVPSSLVCDWYIQDASDIVGKYFKVNVKPGTLITSDLVMAERYDDTLRDVDISVDSWVVGLRVGDYVDINFTLPRGQDYIVLPHKRVMSIGQKTLKMYLTESEWHIYQSVCVDWYLHKSEGARLYLKKYIEPGIQKVATPYYTISKEVNDAVIADPNIVDRAFTQRNTRNAIEQSWAEFVNEKDTVQTQIGLLNSGRSEYTGYVNSDTNTTLRKDKDDNDSYEVEDININLSVESDETVVITKEGSYGETQSQTETEPESTQTETEPESTQAQTESESESTQTEVEESP